MWNRRTATRSIAALILVLSSLGALADAAAAKLEPTDAALRSEFESRSWAYDEYRLRHIFIAVGPTTAHKKPRSESQALARAWALKRQLDAGKDFSMVAQRESDDAATAPIGGELSSMFGVYVADEFIGTVRALAIGEVSQPTRGRDGYHLIRLEERHAADFTMAKPLIEEQLRDHAGAGGMP